MLGKDRGFEVVSSHPSDVSPTAQRIEIQGHGTLATCGRLSLVDPAEGIAGGN
jgi:hypothetical protein